MTETEQTTQPINEQANEQATAEMTNTEAVTETAMPSAEVTTRKSKKLNPIWWLPLLALLLVAYLGVKHFTSRGPLVHVRFENAEGMEVGKTKLRYKDVELGKVEKITLAEDYKSVVVSVRMRRDSENLLREQTVFWVVKPRVSVTRVSGLSTLLSGPYITIDPDKNPESPYRYSFDGLDTPPIVTQDKPGLRLTLLTAKASSLSPGTAVYYKGMEVGTVDRVYFSEDYLWVKADIFIASPHDLLIKQTTKFWSASGISVDAGAAGFDVEMESIETLLAGGIVFETPVTLQKELNVIDGTEYILYENKKQAFEQNHGKKHFYVTYFNSSVKGLETGAPVTLQGINVGKVKDIQLLFDEKTGKTHIPVLFEIYENRLGLVGEDKDRYKMNISQRLIEKGLRTQMATANLLTGAKFISLTMSEPSVDTDDVLIEDPITGYALLPSVPESFDEIASGVTALINKVNQLPLEQIAGNLNTLLATAEGKVSEVDIATTLETLNALIKTADTKVSEIDIKTTLKSFNGLLKEGKTLSGSLKKTLNNLNYSIAKLLKTAQKTLNGFSPDAPLYHNLNTTLLELNDTLNALKALTEMLERTPNALIFGEKK